MRGTQKGKTLYSGRQRNRPAHDRTSSPSRIYDLYRRPVDHPVIVGLQSNPDFLVANFSCHVGNIR
jgi:hypothetical protein